MLMKLCLMARKETYLLRGGPGTGGPEICHRVSGKPLESKCGLSQGKKIRWDKIGRADEYLDIAVALRQGCSPLAKGAATLQEGRGG